MNTDPIAGLSLRQQPDNLLAEKALLGALLANNKALDRCLPDLKPHHFSDPAHGAIFEAIASRVERGRVADALTVRQDFLNSPALDEVGGVAYFGELLGSMVSISAVPDYARTITDSWSQRQLIEIGAELINRAFDPGADASVIAAEALDRLTTALESQSGQKTISLDEAMDAALEAAREAYEMGGVSGLSTGMPTVDAQMAGGLRPDTLTILGARPGMGKTGIAVQWAVNAAREAKRRNDAAKQRVAGGVLVISLEMSASDLGMRVLSCLSRVPGNRIQTGKLDQADFNALAKARLELGGLPLSIEDSAGQSMADIAVKARLAQRRHGLALVVVDHLQIVQTNANDERSGNTVAVGRISGGMKRLAKDLHIPVLVLAQLSREVERREDKRPVLSDLRYSGDIEADADNVGFLYRPEYYLGKSPPDMKPGERRDQYDDRVEAWHDSCRRLAGVAEFNLAKVRSGSTGTVPLRFDGPTTSFSEPTNAA